MKGKKEFTKTTTNQIEKLIKLKLNATAAEQKSIRNKIRRLGFYASDFGLRGGYTVNDFLNCISIVGATSKIQVASDNKVKTKNTSKKRDRSDEAYIINICDEVLKEKALRQHRFSFLKGDSGIKLPVDAYYPNHNLVIEYMEKQHTETVSFFDKRQTVSGVSRGEQRRIYDARRKKRIPENGINFITF